MKRIVPHCLPSSTSSILAVLGRVLPTTVLEAVVADYAVAGSRRRKLPGEVVLQLVIAWHLLPAAALDTVLTTLLLGVRARHPEVAVVPATEGGISRARYRWGARPVVALCRQVCRPLATPETVGAWYHGLRLMALDGTFEDVPDTPANVRAFGRHRSQHGPSAFPQILGLYLLECGTHAIIDAGFWPCHIGLCTAAKRLLRSVDSTMLVLYDQGLHSFALIHALVERQAQVLGRVTPIQTFTPEARLADGTIRCRLWAACPSERTAQTPSLLVRVITYTITDPARVGQQQEHRLLTTLLDPVAYPALDRICTYHERWEIELAIDEMKTHQRLSAQPLRSQRPVGVIQEAYGMLLAHYAVRAVMHDAAHQSGIDPDRISFVHTIRLMTAMLPVFSLSDHPHQDALYRLLLDDLLRLHLPPRRQRIAPRARKRPWFKHRFLRRDGYRIVRVPPFRETLVVLPPKPASLVDPPAA